MNKPVKKEAAAHITSRDSQSLGAPLPGCTRLATLNWRALRNDLKNSDGINIVKKHGKKGFKQVLERSDGVLDF